MNATDSTAIAEPTQTDLATLAGEINEHHRQADIALNHGLEHAYKAGLLLLQAKKQCPHGTWQKWVKENFEGSDRTSRCYMQLAKRMPEVLQNGNGAAVLSMRGALKMFEATEQRKASPGKKQKEPNIAEYTEDIAGELDSFLRGDDLADKLEQVERYQGHLDPSQRERLGRILVDVSERCAKQATKLSGTPTDQEAVQLADDDETELVEVWACETCDGTEWGEDGCCVKCRENGGSPSPQNRATVLTGNMEWYTPAEYISSVHAVMGGIDLDPASCEFAQETVQADAFYTQDEDGLANEWRGRVFLNPPYRMPEVKNFVAKLCSEFVSNNVTEAVLLTNNATDTAWWHLAAETAQAFCLTKGRIHFYNESGEATSPTHGQTFFYFGPSATHFRAEFCRHGFVVMTQAELALEDAS